MITVVGPKGISLPASLGGNDQTFLLVQIAASRGLYVEPIAGDRVQLQGITDRELLNLDTVRMLVSAGADVLGYPVWFVFDDPAVECPLIPGWPWGEAFGVNHRPEPFNGRWLQANELTRFFAEGGKDDGEALPASVWINSGVELLTIEEKRALEPRMELT
jgi:hypothetical protein